MHFLVLCAVLCVSGRTFACGSAFEALSGGVGVSGETRTFLAALAPFAERAEQGRRAFGMEIEFVGDPKAVAEGLQRAHGGVVDARIRPQGGFSASGEIIELADGKRFMVVRTRDGMWRLFEDSHEIMGATDRGPLDQIIRESLANEPPERIRRFSSENLWVILEPSNNHQNRPHVFHWDAGKLVSENRVWDAETPESASRIVEGILRGEVPYETTNLIELKGSRLGDLRIVDEEQGRFELNTQHDAAPYLTPAQVAPVVDTLYQAGAQGIYERNGKREMVVHVWVPMREQAIGPFLKLWQDHRVHILEIADPHPNRQRIDPLPAELRTGSLPSLADVRLHAHKHQEVNVESLAWGDKPAVELRLFNVADGAAAERILYFSLGLVEKAESLVPEPPTPDR